MAGQMRWSAPPIVERAPPPETARVGSRCQHEGARLRLVLGFLPSQRGQGVQSGQVPRAKGPTTVARGRNTAVAAAVSQPPASRWKPRAITSKSVTAAATQSSQLRSVAGKAANY